MSDTSPSLLDQMMFVVRGDTVLQETASGRRVPRVGSMLLADGETKTIAVTGDADETARMVFIGAPGEGPAVTSAIELVRAGALDGDMISIRVTVQAGGLFSVWDGPDRYEPRWTVEGGSSPRTETIAFLFIGGNWVVWSFSVIQAGEVP